MFLAAKGMPLDTKLAHYQRRWRRIDPLVRMMIVNWIGGMLVGVICATLLLVFDFAGIRTLLFQSDMAVAGVAMLMASFAFTFGGLVCAAAVMRADDDDDRGPPRGGRKRGLASKEKLAFASVGATGARSH